MTDQVWVWAEVDAQDDHVTLEGVASVRRAQAARLEAACERLLAGMAQMGLGPGGPIEQGHGWDVDVHRQTDGDWLTLTVTWVGPAETASALVQTWGEPE